jgi:adenylate cyclase class 2
MANKKGIKPVSKEIEAKFFIEKDEFIKKLKQIKAKLVTPERTMKRKVFGIVNEPKYFRVRDEGGKITMTCKVITGRGIHDVFESEIEVSNFDKACEILTLTGLPLKAYQETTRET